MEDIKDISFYIRKFSNASDLRGYPYLLGILSETNKYGLVELTLDECKEYDKKYFPPNLEIRR